MATEHFTDDELCCPHCGKCLMDKDFLELLEEIREAYGKPMYLTSAYRCPEYNIRISNTGARGPHTTGKAVDVMVSGESAYKLMSTAVYHGVTGVGVNQRGSYAQRFLHLDTVHNDYRPRVWSY